MPHQLALMRAFVFFPISSSLEFAVRLPACWSAARAVFRERWSIGEFRINYSAGHAPNAIRCYLRVHVDGLKAVRATFCRFAFVQTMLNSKLRSI